MKFTKELQNLIESMPQSFVEDGYVEQALIQVMENAKKNYVPKVVPLLEKKLSKMWLKQINSREHYGKDDYRVILCNDLEDLKSCETREEKTIFVGKIEGFLEAFATGLLVKYNYDMLEITKQLKSKATIFDDYCYHLDNYDELSGWYCDLWNDTECQCEYIWLERC